MEKIIIVIMNKTKIQLLILILISISMSSCKLFRKKNKCDTCPSWKTQIEQLEEGRI